MPTDTDHLTLIIDASRPVDVFGPLEGDSVPARLNALKKVFRRLARATHPDHQPAAPDLAGQAFARLGQLYERAKDLIHRAQYETGGIVDGVAVRTKRHAYEVGGALFTGGASTYYEATCDGDDALVKVAQDSRDNDLITNEARMIRALMTDDDARDKAAFFPAYIEAFRLRVGGATRQAIAFRRGYRPLHSFAQVLGRYPYGIDPRDTAWMFRRLLFALGLAARAGVVHGAVILDHVLIHAGLHGLVLVDWKHAVKPGERLRAIPSGWRYWYPADVITKNPADPGVDIYMAAQCARAITRAPPDRMVTFWRGCMMDSAVRRPQDAWEVLGQFDELIEGLYGPRQFRPFTMDPKPEAVP